MKRLKNFALTVLALPFILAALWCLYQVFGLCANHTAASARTRTLQTSLESAIPDVEILHTSWETGNLSGTGNHVDCLSSVLFATALETQEIQERLSESYTFDAWDCDLTRTGDGTYRMDLRTPAPFPDNLEGH